MKTVRLAVFETNSSSEHSVTITDAETFHSWTLDEALFLEEEQSFKTLKEVFDEMKADKDADDSIKAVTFSEFDLFVTYSESVRRYAHLDCPEDTLYDGFKQYEHLTPETLKNLWWWMHNNGYVTFDEYKSDEELEFWSEKSDVKGFLVVAFGKYGFC